jgi:branched-chain amino acid transport system permease protein
VTSGRARDLGRLRAHLGWVGLVVPLALAAWLPSDVAGALTVASVGAVLATAWAGLARSGLLSFGMAAPFGTGAYAAGLLLARGANALWVAPAAGVAGILCSLVLALGSRWRRLPLAAFAVLTLAWAEVLHTAALNLPFTGGPSGVLLPRLPGAQVTALLGLAAALLASLALALASGPRLRPLLAAVASDPARAEALGLPASLVKEVALAASGLAAGLAGALSAWSVGFVEPESAFSPLLSALAMAAAVGGSGPAWGPAALALSFSVADQLYLAPRAPALHGLAVAGLLVVVLAARRLRALPAPGMAPRRDPRTGRPPAPPRRPAPGGRVLLEVRDVQVVRDGITALAWVSLEVSAGEVLGVAGPNGSGKTTLLDAVSGLVRYRGAVLLAGRPIDRLAPHARARLGIGRTFQVPRPVPGLTGQELLGLGLRRRALSLPGPVHGAPWLAVDRWGPRPSTGCTPSELRRMELARAVASGPRVLLLDEPAAGLATSLLPELAVSIRQAAAAGAGVVVVEHTPSLMLRVASRVVRLREGRVA